MTDEKKESTTPFQCGRGCDCECCKVHIEDLARKQEALRDRLAQVEKAWKRLRAVYDEFPDGNGWLAMQEWDGVENALLRALAEPPQVQAPSRVTLCPEPREGGPCQACPCCSYFALKCRTAPGPCFCECHGPTPVCAQPPASTPTPSECDCRADYYNSVSTLYGGLRVMPHALNCALNCPAPPLQSGSTPEPGGSAK